MPESSRRDAPSRNPEYPQGAEREELPAGPTKYQQPHAVGSTLPPGDVYGQLPRSRAENFGRSVGSAVSGLLHFPQQAKSRIRQVGRNTRNQASAVVLEMMDTAADRADRIRHAAEATVSDWARTARSAGAQVGNQTVEVWDEFRHIAGARLDYAGRRAVARWNQTQRVVARMQQEDPGRFLAIVAGVAFVVGAGLRVWRSGNE